LALLRPRAPSAILFADYDGIGLQNYARLRDRRFNNCEFWLMPNWAELLHQHGNRDIWLNNLANFQDALARLQTQAMSPMLCESESTFALLYSKMWIILKTGYYKLIIEFDRDRRALNGAA
jgi:hypothetical protein